MYLSMDELIKMADNDDQVTSELIRRLRFYEKKCPGVTPHPTGHRKPIPPTPPTPPTPPIPDVITNLYTLGHLDIVMRSEHTTQDTFDEWMNEHTTQDTFDEWMNEHTTQDTFDKWMNDH